MLPSVKPAIADIESSHESNLLVDHYHFLMMGPQKRDQHVIGMEYHFDIVTQLGEVGLCELRIDIQGHFWSIVNDDIHLNACVGDVT